jgi:hypothetical protein
MEHYKNTYLNMKMNLIFSLSFILVCNIALGALINFKKDPTEPSNNTSM